jgi:O-antigen ligase
MSVKMSSRNVSESLQKLIITVLLPVGLLALLTGMFWIGRHGLYPKIHLYLITLPTVLLVLLRPTCVADLVKSPIFCVALAFFGLVLSSLLWAQPESTVLSLMRRPLMIGLIFLATHQVAANVPRRFELVLIAALSLSTCFAIYTLGRFVLEGGGARLSGYGALYNPLLVSHVFGFFAALGLGYYFADKRLLAPAPLMAFVSLGAILIATGSRTPLVAIAATLFWMTALTSNRKALLVLSAVVAVGTLSCVVWPEVFTQRGFSYRPQIWAEALRQIREAPWFGHGFDTPMQIKLDDFDHAFPEPHNLTLSVMYDLGVVGLLAWLALYGVALYFAWARRARPVVMAVSATVVYGLFAGMTEGGAFLSRPKEHWFVVWIPLALLSALSLRKSVDHGLAKDIA